MVCGHRMSRVMKRSLAMLLILVLAFQSAVLSFGWNLGTAAASSVNLIKNPGLESGRSGDPGTGVPTDWSYYKSATKSHPAFYDVVTDQSHSGGASFYFKSATAATRAKISQEVPVTAGKVYDFSVWLKGKSIVSNGVGASAIVTSHPGNVPLTIPGNTFKGTYDWQQLKYRYTVPDGVSKLELGIWIWDTTGGELWIDDVSLTEVVPVTAVTFEAEQETLGIGQSLPLQAQVIPANATNPGLRWTSDNPAVASVSSAGVVTAVAVGSTRIWAESLDDPAVRAFYDLAVVPLNLLENGGFELSSAGLPANWNYYGAVELEAADAGVVNDVYYSGGASLHIASSAPSRLGFQQMVNVMEGRTYELRQWLRTGNVDGSSGGGATVTAQVYQSGIPGPVIFQPGVWSGTHEWSPVSGSLTIPAGYNQLYIRNEIAEATGEVWFDDAVLQIVNSDPIAAEPVLQVTVKEDQPSSGVISVTDPDGDTLTYDIAVQPAYGVAAVDDSGGWVYTPANAGNTPVFTDSFQVSIYDGQGGSTSVTVKLTVNHMPRLQDSSVLLHELAPVAGTLAGMDMDGDPLQFAKSGEPLHGQAVVNADGSFTYTPGDTFADRDSFLVSAYDGFNAPVTASVTIIRGLADELSDFSRMEFHTDGLIADPHSYFRDYRRDISTVYRTSTAPEHFIYRMPYPVTSLRVDAYHHNTQSSADLRFFGSADGIAYTELTAAKSGDPAKLVENQGWYPVAYTVPSIDSATRYIKVAIEEPAGPWLPRIDRVAINDTSAPQDKPYYGPYAAEIIQTLKERNPQQAHPRIMADADDFARIRTQLTTDANLGKWYANIKVSADQLLATSVSQYTIVDTDYLLQVSRQVLDCIQKWGFMYQMTGDMKYVNRAWLELQAAGNFPNWYPKHMLDTAEMTHAFAIAYDWMYDAWTPEQREFIRNAIVNKGLKAALDAFNGIVDGLNFKFVNGTNNWNPVCNGGFGLGALVIADEEPAIAGQVLEQVFRSLPKGLESYGPGGATDEGVTYWEYGTLYLAYFLSGLGTAMGTDYGLGGYPGLSQTGYFPIALSGPGGTFNFNDSNSNLIGGGPLFLWLADRYTNTDFSLYHKQMAPAGKVMDMIWYNQTLYEGSLSGQTRQLDHYFPGMEEPVTFRSSWEDSNGLFVGFKAGDNQTTHGDMDVGDFVFDALGVRWAMNLGADTYALPSYSDYSTPAGTRWTYYRKKGEGQNTIVINPDALPEQEPYSTNKMERIESQAEGAFAIADMTAAYWKKADSAKRGVFLTDHRRQLLIQDEIKTKEPSDIWWFMHTQADMEISPDGHSALLTRLGQRLWVSLLSPSDPSAQLVAMAADPLPTSPHPTGENSRAGIRKLAVKVTGAEDPTIAVLLTPLQAGEPLPSQLPAVKPLAEWIVEADEVAQLNSLKADGASVEGFSPLKQMYTVMLPPGTTKAPAVEAAGCAGCTVEIVQAAGLPGTASVKVTSADNGRTTYYSVQFKRLPYLGLPANGVELPVAEATASAYQNNPPKEVNPPASAIDKDLTTKWAAQNDQWLQLDLGQEEEFNFVSMAWASGDTRTSPFQIDASNDGEAWTELFDGISSGLTAGYESYILPVTKARYVRIRVHGNSTNQWNSLLEAGVFLAEPEQPPIEPETPKPDPDPETPKEPEPDPDPEPPVTNPPVAVGDNDSNLGQAPTVPVLTDDGHGQLSVTMPSTAKEIRIPANRLDLNTLHSLKIKRDSLSLLLPPEVLQQLKSELSDAQWLDSSISVMVNPLSAEDSGALMDQAQAAADASLKLFGDAYEIAVQLIANGNQATRLNTFIKPLTLRLPVDSAVDDKLVSVYRITDGGLLEYNGGAVQHGEIAAEIVQSGKYAAMEYRKPFQDVQGGHWASSVIAQLAARQIVAGTSAGLFEPERAISRAEFAALLVRALKLSGKSELTFTDVAKTDWYFDPTAIAVHSGIAAGVSDADFLPNAPITREEMAVMLIRAYQLRHPEAIPDAPLAFADQDDISPWAAAYVNSARALQLVQGRREGAFVPKGISTRAEAAQAVYNLLHHPQAE